MKHLKKYIARNEREEGGERGKSREGRGGRGREGGGQGWIEGGWQGTSFDGPGVPTVTSSLTSAITFNATRLT